MPAPNGRMPQFEAAFRESDRTNDFHRGPYGIPIAFREVEVEHDAFGPIMSFEPVDPERMQSGNLSDAPDDGGPDAAPGNRRGWSSL